MARIALNLGDCMPSGLKEKILECLKTCKIGRSGKNRVWLAECVLMRAKIEHDESTFRSAWKALVDEIRVSDGIEGIQSDWSFHQHGNMPQFGNYGAAYILTMARLVSEYKETEFAIPEDKVEILRCLVRKEFEAFVWKGRMDVGALGRQLSKDIQACKAKAIEYAKNWLGMTCESSAADGLSFFQKSAMAAYRNNRWMVTVKAETSEIKGIETLNEDNRLGAHLADGALFSYVTGREYDDVFPCWNWRHIPGTTTYDVSDIQWMDDNSKLKIRNKANKFVRSGETGIEFVLDRDGLQATSRIKFSDDGVEVSVNGITSAEHLPVVTTVEQSLAQPNARWWKEGEHIIAVNGGIRYELPANAEVVIEPRLGSWNRVMGSMPDKQVCKRIFEVVIPHGPSPTNASCSWRFRFPVKDDGLSCPLVSVVVPIYNVEKFVGECLDSLIAQTYPNIEVICVNDGSTDASPDVLRKYADRFPAPRKLTIINQENAGLSAARNSGMDKATGKYIYFLDPDDMIVPETIENLVNLAEVNCLDQVIFKCQTIADGDDPALIRDAESKARNYYVVPADMHYRMLDGKQLFSELIKRGHFYATQQMRFYRRDLLVANNLRYPVGLVHEDNYMAPISLFFSKRAVIADEEWFIRRVRANSIMTASGDKSKRLQGMLCVAQLLSSDKRLWDNHDDFEQAMQKFLAGLLVGVGQLAVMSDPQILKEIFVHSSREYNSLGVDFVINALLPYLMANKERSTLWSRLKAEQKSRGELFSQLQETQKARSKLFLRLQESQKSRGELFSKLQESQKSRGELFSKLQESQKSRGELFSKLQDAQKARGELFTKLQDSQKAHGDLFARFQKTQKECDELSKKLQDELMSSQTTRQNLECTIHEYKTTLEQIKEVVK